MSLNKWLRTKIAWVAPLIVVAILSTIVATIKPIILKFEILIIILLLALILTFLLYGIDFYKGYKEILLYERVPTDTILKRQHKKVVFDDITFEGRNEARVSTFRRLLNNMSVSNETYDRFLIAIASEDDVPHLDEITLIKSNKSIELNKLDPEITQPRRCLEFDSDKLDFTEELDISKPEKKSVEFFIPLQLEAGKKCDFEINYLTGAYENAIKGEEDYIQERVNRITDELTIEVILEGKMKNMYEITPCVDKKDGSMLTFHIFDASFERMKRTESQLTADNMIPNFKKDSAIWTIINPKIGYEFRMYFKLIKKII